MINWFNVDLNSAYERDQFLLDPMSFDCLLLEINCNLREINEETVTAQFEEDLKERIKESREVFGHNLTNIVNKAREEREENQ